MTSTIQTTASTMLDPPSDTDDDSTARTGPTAARGQLLAGLRAGRYPTVPARLRTAVDALRRIEDEALRVAQSPPEGLGVYCQRVAAGVLAGEPWPGDFTEAAYAAQRSADRLAASSSALQAVRQVLHERFAAVVADCLPELLGGLRGQLDEVMAELRKVDDALDDLDFERGVAVAAATNKQRAALLALDGLRANYHRIRSGQRAALAASAVVAPGTTAMTVSHGWPDVFASGVHEFSDVHKRGVVPGHAKPAARLRAVARRPDVWLPDADELAAAWNKLHARSEPAAPAVKVPGYNALRHETSGSTR